MAVLPGGLVSSFDRLPATSSGQAGQAHLATCGNVSLRSSPAVPRDGCPVAQPSPRSCDGVSSIMRVRGFPALLRLPNRLGVQRYPTMLMVQITILQATAVPFLHAIPRYFKNCRDYKILCFLSSAGPVHWSPSLGRLLNTRGVRVYKILYLHGRSGGEP
jgi:hypothetical protein